MRKVLLAAFVVLLGAFAGVSAFADAIPIGKFFSNGSATVGQVVQIVAPATNVNGLYLRTAQLQVWSTNSGVAVFASPTAPANCCDASTRNIFEMASGVGGVSQNLPNQLFIPAGMGIWIGANGSVGWELTYDLQQ